jgi:hypothetical protein
MNTFDALTHTYRINDRPVPSVTQVLADLIPGWKASEWHLQRGQAVHACAALIAQGIEFEHDPAIDGQVRACRKFFAEVKPEVIEVEAAVYSKIYNYAGRYDMLAKIGNKWIIVDWKASISPALPYQLAAYSLETFTDHGCGVVLKDTGEYAMTEIYDLKRFKQGWLSLLTAYNIRRKCGIKEEGKDE